MHPAANCLKVLRAKVRRTNSIHLSRCLSESNHHPSPRGLEIDPANSTRLVNIEEYDAVKFRGRPLGQAHAQSVLHLYRWLLRATSYLPDSFAQEYIHQHIVSQFKKTRERFQHKAARADARAKIAVKFKQALAAHGLLVKAGNGDMEALKHVLKEAHGRIGRRRRSLLSELRVQTEEELPMDASQLEKFIKGVQERQIIDGQPSKRFVAYLKSQLANQPRDLHKSRLKNGVTPKVPKENLWGRPFPVKRAKCVRNKWWASTLHRVVPPIPRSEFDRLQALATNQMELDPIPPRRTRPKTAEPEATYAELLSRLRGSNWVPGSKRTYDEELVYDVNARLLRLLPVASTVPEPMSNRSRRRLYAHIWSLTATMWHDLETMKWKVKWGGLESKDYTGPILQASAADAELFEENGVGQRLLQEKETSTIHMKQIDKTEKREEMEGAYAREETAEPENLERPLVQALSSNIREEKSTIST